MDTPAEEKAKLWVKAPFDSETQAAVKRLLETSPQELQDAFYTDLSFGTGGLRGIMGVGSNRMNLYTIRKTTQGLIRYLKKQFPKRPLYVVIGFDSRLHSEEFAKEAADELSHEHITVFLLAQIRPTPYLSFLCRQLKGHAAIMITASHNPKEYNGYKVYWQDGAQVVPPHDMGILEEIEKIAGFSAKSPPVPSSIHSIKDEYDCAYIAAIRPLQCFPKENHLYGKDLSLVYTSLHGTGGTIIPKALADWGFSTLFPVLEQIAPDPEFPTVKFPNPEYPEALQLGTDLLLKQGADLLLATDPDADRLGVVVRHQGKPIALTGNEIASLCVEYLCSNWKKQEKLPPKPAVITTIVSTDLIEAICQFHEVHCCKVLTGFKYIGEKIHQWEEDPHSNSSYSFLFGAEESYGYLLGTHARDKDAIVSCCLLAEIALHLKKQGKTLVHFLEELYQHYGVFRQRQLSLEFSPGKEGMESMKTLMESLRKTPPILLAEKRVLSFQDYLSSQDSALPQADVLSFFLEDDTKFIIRPSGTEPKIKVYGSIKLSSFSSVQEGIQQADSILHHHLHAIQKELS